MKLKNLKKTMVKEICLSNIIEVILLMIVLVSLFVLIIPTGLGLNLILSPFWVFKLRSNVLSTNFLVMGELTSPGA
jgi:hypothetical protein